MWFRPQFYLNWEKYLVYDNHITQIYIYSTQTSLIDWYVFINVNIAVLTICAYLYVTICVIPSQLVNGLCNSIARKIPQGQPGGTAPLWLIKRFSVYPIIEVDQ